MWKEITLAVLVSFLGKTEGSGVEKCTVCADIFVLIDISSSTSSDNFGTTITFTKDFVRSFSNIGPNGAQFGAVFVSGSSNKTTAFDLNDHSNVFGLINTLESIPKSRSHLGPALEYLLERNLFSVDGEDTGAGRPCAVDNRFAIAITDGKSFGDPIPKAQSLKNANVKILAVGVGEDINISLLQAIASGNQNVFHVGDFINLSSILDGVVSAICTQNSGPHGFCGFPCTLHNKTYDLCSCDVDNVNQTYSVGGNDTTVFTENFVGEKKMDWECYTRSGRFYVVRRRITYDVFEYRCMRDIMYNTDKDIRVYCMSEWASFEGNPSLCDVCDGSAFDKDKRLIIKEQSEECGVIILESGFCGCALPTICPVTNNVTQTQCDACESSEGNDDGLCCST